MKANPFEMIYQKGARDVPWGYDKPDDKIISILEKMHLSPGTKVLDAGCGNGKNSVFLAEMGFNVYGFDLSNEAIKAAKKRLSSGHFVVSAVNQLPYKDKYFDVVIDVGLFHCVPLNQRNQAIEEMIRVLKPGGYFIIREFVRPENHPVPKPLFYEYVDRAGRTIRRDRKHIQFPVWGFSFEQLRVIFQQQCFIEKVKYAGNRIILIMTKKKRGEPKHS